MKVYLSGYLALKKWEHELHEAVPGIKRCISYAYTREHEVSTAKLWNTNIIPSCWRDRVPMFLDSGAFTFLNTRKSAPAHVIDDFFTGYLRYLDRPNEPWDFYVNFDYVKQAPIIYRMQRRMEKLGYKPVPVFHGDSGYDWLRRYIDDGHKLIMIGRYERLGSDALRRYYSRVFEITEAAGVGCHGLMVTGLNMFRFPWASVDSASWVKLAGYGNVVIINNRPLIHSFHYKKFTPAVIRTLKEYPAPVTVKKLAEDYRYRALWNAYYYANVKPAPAHIARQTSWSSIL